MDEPASLEPAAPRRRGGVPVTLVLFLAGLAWAATPVLWYGALIVGAAFFGEQPTPEEQATSFRLLLAALACGLLVPAAAMLLALASGRRTAAALCAVALALSVAAGVASGTFTRDNLRDLNDRLAPTELAPDPGPRPCVELSGGDNRCPGG
jgi:Na+/proline symporter